MIQVETSIKTRASNRNCDGDYCKVKEHVLFSLSVTINVLGLDQTEFFGRQCNYHGDAARLILHHPTSLLVYVAM